MSRLIYSILVFASVSAVYADSFLYQGPGPITGTATVHLSGVPGSAVNETVYTGENWFTFGTDPKTYGYCVDLQSNAGNGTATRTDTSTITGGGSIGYLINKYAPIFHATGNKQGAAALQLAIWDLEYETPAGDMQPAAAYAIDMNSGHFTASNFKVDGVTFDPSSYLTTFSSELSNSEFATRYAGLNGSIQSFAAPVPEPTTIAALAIGAMGMLRRRRRR